MLDLIKRLEEATGPCRGLDRAIQRHFGLPFSEVLQDKPFLINAYTSSIDAAVALAERVLPNERPRLDRIQFDGSKQWRALMTGNHVSWAPTAALALCIAILKAKEVGQ